MLEVKKKEMYFKNFAKIALNFLLNKGELCD